MECVTRDTVNTLGFYWYL